MVTTLRCALYVACFLALSGCAVVQGQLDVSFRNRPDLSSSILQPSKAVPRASREWVADKPTFVGVAISGGGMRSAAFGMDVLAELGALGILPQVDAVSAVSGGAIPAALFGLYGGTPGWVERGQVLASTNLVRPLLVDLIDPLQVLARTFTDRDRTDSLAELFERFLFDGRRPVFGDLGERGPLRPALYFNATDTTAGGERFVFEQERFFELLGSDLSSYPLAWAMAASGAFPGVFNSVTLRRYGLDPFIRGKELDSVHERRYVHLIDGGTTDNLGVQTLIELARKHHVGRVNAGELATGCLLIVIDAHVPNAGIAQAIQSDRRNFGSTLLDLNFLDAIDAMLSVHRDSTLESLGIHRSGSNRRFDVDLGGGLIEYDVAPYSRVGSLEIGYHDQGGLASANGMGEASTARHFTCTTWHVPLQGVQSIWPWRMSSNRPIPLDPKNERDRPVFAYRGRLERLVTQVDTSYKLSGPPNCSTELVRRSLHDVAHIAVRQDKDALDRICGWFGSRGIQLDQCRPEPDPLVRSDLALEPIVSPRNRQALEQRIHRFVQCSEPAEVEVFRN